MDAIIKITSPTGLRQQKIAQAIDQFNTGKLAPLCKAAGWPLVAIAGEDLGTTYGGRIYSLISKSAQLKVRIILQLAMAALDRSSLGLEHQVEIPRLRELPAAFRADPVEHESNVHGNGLYALQAHTLQKTPRNLKPDRDSISGEI